MTSTQENTENSEASVSSGNGGPKRKRKGISMTEGPLLGGLIRFSLPIFATSTLQILFNVADLAVVGKFAGNSDVAAVGATGALIGLLVNFFVGISVGANVVTARMIGAKNSDGVHRSVHTSMLISVIFGVIVGITGFFCAEPVLEIMNTPVTVLPLATLYMKIYLIGSPVNMIMNFGSAVMRAAGDSRRPLIFMTISGCLNVVLNLISVIIFGMGVAGVAIATVSSQALSAFLIVFSLIREKSDIHLSLRRLRIYKDELASIVKIGLPQGLQSSLFSLSNVVIQSSYNSFGETVVAGMSIGQNLEGFVYCGMGSVVQAVLTFTGQNYGAGKFRRMRRVLFISIAYVTVLGMILGYTEILLSRFLTGFYTNDTDVMRYACERIFAINIVYFILGVQDVISGFLRGIGKSVFPMVTCIVGIIGFRFAWVYLVFPYLHTPNWLNISYPLSWVICMTILVPGCIVYMKKIPKEDSEPQAHVS